ncbi:MAG TPA: FUSC family protein [Acidimicrobiales bacterium]|nr:FUSC family protein [Acidimicrobiales bacterium]
MATTVPTEGRLRRGWHRFTQATSWTTPTSTEVGVVVKAGLAAGLAWAIADLVTNISNPVLAPLTALVTVRVSVRASVSRAVLRSAAVVLGVLLALAIGDTIRLNGLTVGLLVAASLAIAELLLRMPTWAATQMPVSVLVVLAAVSASQRTNGWWRAVDTLIGAAVGIGVSLALPASRLVDARQGLERLADGLGDSLDEMGHGLQHAWSEEQTTEWRRDAHVTRERLVAQASEAIGDSREAARWNHRDRRHLAELIRLEDLLPRAERVAIGVSAIARTLDEFAQESEGEHAPMPKLSALLVALGDAVRSVADDRLNEGHEEDAHAAVELARTRRDECSLSAIRRAELALQHENVQDRAGGEWLGYAALLVHVDRIIRDLTAPLPH